MLRYPFNKYGFYDYIESPIRQFFRRQKVFKNIELWNFDVCNIPETVFAHFKYFCEDNKFYFINQYCLETHCPKDVNPEEWVSAFYDKYEAYRRLNEIQEYVLYTRDLNKAKVEYLSNLWHSSWKAKWIDSTIHKDCVEFTTEDYFYLEVNFWFEQGELMYDYKKVDHKTGFNPLDIEDAMTKLDRQYAKEIIDYSGYIWN